MADYLARVIASASFGALLYLAAWMVFAYAFRWVGMGGAALGSVVLLHITTLHGRTWKEVL